MALTKRQRTALADVLEIHQEDVNTHVGEAIATLEGVGGELTAAQALALAQTHALLALGLRLDSLVTILSAAALPELAPEEIVADDAEAEE